MPVEITPDYLARSGKTPYLWTVQKPNGTHWRRHFKSIDSAWHSLCGAAHLKKLFYGNVANAKKLGYTVVPVAWRVTHAS